MANTTFSIQNFNRPAPKWVRLSKRIIYLLAGSSIATGTLDRFGVSSEDQKLIMGWLLIIGEIISIMTANGEVYAQADNTQVTEEQKN